MEPYIIGITFLLLTILNVCFFSKKFYQKGYHKGRLDEYTKWKKWYLKHDKTYFVDEQV